MAFYDQLNSFFTGESEDERRRREEEERLRIERETPVKQTIETDPVTGAQKVKIEGSAYNLSAANPLTPTVTGGPVQPVRPEDLLPPGEQYVGTPGIAPAATGTTMPGAPMSSTTVTPEELERRFREFTQGREPVRSDTGQVMGYETPQEMIQGAATNAPVQRPPEAPVAPTAPVMTPAVATAPTATAPTTAPAVDQRLTQPMEAMPAGIAGPAPGVMGEKDWAQTFARSQQDPQALATIQADATAPSWVRQLAAETQYENMRVQKLNQRAEQMVTKAVESGNMLEIDRAIKKEGEEGSILKAFLYSKLGLNDLARDEQSKLAGGEWQTVMDPATGKTGMVKFNRNGLPTQGINADGSAMTTKELAGFGAGGQGKALDIVGGTVVSDTLKDAQGRALVGRVVTDKRTGQSFVQTDMGRMPMAGFRPQSSTGSMESYRQKLQLEAQSRFATMTAQQRLDVWKNASTQAVNAGFQPFTLAEMGLAPDGSLIGQPRAGMPAQPSPVAPGAQPAPAQPAVVTPVAPGAQPAPAAAPTTAATTVTGTPSETGGRPTAVTLEAQAEARKDIVKKSGELISQQASIVRDLNSAQRNIKILESGRTNFGTIIGGTIPGERAVGELFKTKDAVNTKSVMEYVNKLNASNVKALGTNPTDRDLIFVTSNTPDETWNEKDVIEWIRRSEQGQRNALRIAKEQIRTGGTYEEPVPAEGETGTGNTVADRARAELEKRKKEKKQ